MMMAIAPITQEIRAAVPAAWAAKSAPKSQPDPMMDPSEVQIRPISPMSRLRPGFLGVTGATAAVGDASMVHLLFRQGEVGGAWSSARKIAILRDPRHRHRKDSANGREVAGRLPLQECYAVCSPPWP